MKSARCLTNALSACGFYLAGCSSSFWHGKMHVFQLLFSASTRNDLPLTRSWMSEGIDGEVGRGKG